MSPHEFVVLKRIGLHYNTQGATWSSHGSLEDH